MASIQGMVYGFILFRSTKLNKWGNRILGLMLFLLSYRLIIQVMRLFGLGYYDTWYYFMIDLSWAHGALIYFYTKAQTRPGFKFGKRDLIHFAPMFVQVAISVFVRLQNLYWDGTPESLSWLGYYGYSIWMNHSTIYLVASILIIYYAQKSLGLIKQVNKRDEMPKGKLSWIKRITLSFLIYFTLVLFILVVDLIVYKSYNKGDYFYFTRFYYYPFFIGIGILTYWIGLEGFSRRHEQELAKRVVPNHLEMKKLEDIAERVRAGMEQEGLYKNPELSLQGLAKSLELKPYLVSRSLSEVLDKRFNDFVNECRVKEVQRLLKDPRNSRFTLLSLAMDAGFNSKSSFNRAVKKHLGVMPSDLKFDGGENLEEIKG